MPDALNAYAQQADVQIFFPSEKIASIRSVPIKGKLKTDEALRRLIAGSGLEIARKSGGTIMLRAASEPARKASGATVVSNEPIVVTGSRIARTEEDTSTPVSTIDRTLIEASGSIVLEDVLTRQPQYSGGFTSRSNNPGTGAAQIDLRGLGSNRNLVLVNGRRYVFFGQDQVTDINVIPAALVERIETVTGGSSAVYGSDAIAGVTNFILRDDFEGIEARAQLGGDTRGDGQTYSLDLTAGTNFADDRGNFVISGSYYKRDGIRQAARAYAGRVLDDGYDENWNPALVETGSLRSPDGSFSYIPYGDQLLQPGMEGLRDALSAAGLADIGPTGFTFDGAGSDARVHNDPADRYNYALLNYLQTPAKRYGVSAFTHFDASDALTLYGEFSYYRNEVDMQLAEANLAGTMRFDVTNPYVSPEMNEVFRQLDLLETGDAYNDGLVSLRVNRRFTEFGPREALVVRDSYRAGGGIRGDLGDLGGQFLRNVHYDLNYFYSRADSSTHLNNMVSYSGLAAGILSVDGADPLVNLFGAGGISDEAVRQLKIDTSNPTETELQVASAIVTSDVAPLPAGPLSMSLGFEWRSAYARSSSDPALESGDAVGFDAYSPTEGEVNVYEIFGEMRLPLLSEESPIGRVTANGAFRYSDYDLTVANGVWTYLGGLEWAPVPGLNLRGQWQHAVRAPNIGELFGGQSADRPRATDPCADPSAAADPTLRDLCIATGVPANLVGSPIVQTGGRVDALYGGNPDLDVEKSDTYTFGFTLAPRAVPNLRVSVDYFHIEVKDAISMLAGGVESTLDLCYNVIQDPASDVCQAIRRDPADGVIAAPYSILATYTNIGKLETSGIDFGVSWSQPLAFGIGGNDSHLAIDIRGTWLEKYAITPVQDLPDQVYECEGAFGLTCGGPFPRFKTASRITWSSGGLMLSAQHRHLSAVTDDRILVPARSGESGPTKADLAAPVMGSRDYVDISVSYEVGRTGLTFFGGVNNVFDVDPPIVADSQQQANTYPSTYDALGAEYFVGAKLRF
ncbi:TonB-dependent receptor [Novosphingobium mangrovi (ex Huang et al. 2023)]|uniref:TonB-dependent receptor n=1 Tax=Novosphingobium mangrovi (ex Huang et al. 2023) TaxID=2976432 RepID=A0ABT2I1M3_9SPHN|nr:TonB-dependent receptor [Novosphingobium mangrovi (ex Huang et al. 2023)]MCT2398701.1 TonB-dependent receptor [Novosphingobium mangrovi (ex Huang et al. 2023)]